MTIITTLWPEEVERMANQLQQTAVPSYSQIENVEKDLEDMAWVCGHTPEWHVLRARCFAAKGEVGEALAALSNADGVEIGNPGLLSLLARTLLECGRLDEGLARLREVVRMDPNAAQLWEEIGNALAGGGDVESALAIFENCFEALPHRFDILLKIGDCYRSLGKLQAAKTAYEAVMAAQGSEPNT
jgi:tetratricopeptide (TPR) repeat protein